MGIFREDGDRVNYTRYRTTLVTINQGTIVGRADQHLPEVVTEHYGAPAGYLPWHDPERPDIVGLIVDPPQQTVGCRLAEGEVRPIEIRTTQRVRDWVLSMTQEAVR